MTNPSAPARLPADVTPDELLTGFSTSHIVRWFLVALLLHAIVIGGFSIGTIRDSLDPEGAKARQEAALAAAKAAAAPAAAAPAEPTATASQTAAAAKPDAPQTAIEKATTEAAKPEDIPDAPDDLGLSIEDTNVK